MEKLGLNDAVYLVMSKLGLSFAILGHNPERTFMSIDAGPNWTRSLLFFCLLKAVCNFKSQKSNCSLIIVNAIMCVSSIALLLKAEHCWEWDASVW